MTNDLLALAAQELLDWYETGELKQDGVFKKYVGGLTDIPPNMRLRVAENNIQKEALRAASTRAPELDREAVATELLAHGVFSSIEANNRPNALLAADAIIALLPDAPVEPEPVGEVEPVAWCWQQPGWRDYWIYNPEPAWLAEQNNIIKQPLYTAPIPSPAADVERLREALDSIRQYGADTLSGRAGGGIDDRQWQREAVREMTRRARVALSSVPSPAPARAALQAALGDGVVVSALRFVQWAMQEGPWNGCDLDGGATQDKAEALGLIIEVPYDPAIHGPSEFDIDTGEAWFVLHPDIVSMLAAASPADMPSTREAGKT